MNGPNGLLNLININEQIKNNQIYLEKLKKEKEILLIKNHGLYEESINLDLLEEEAKKLLGYIGKQNEFIIIMNKD